MQRLARHARRVDVRLQAAASRRASAQPSSRARHTRTLNTMMPSRRRALVTSERQRASVQTYKVQAAAARTQQDSRPGVSTRIHGRRDTQLRGDGVNAFSGNSHLNGPLDGSSQPAQARVGRCGIISYATQCMQMSLSPEPRTHRWHSRRSTSWLDVRPTKRSNSQIPVSRTSTCSRKARCPAK